MKIRPATSMDMPQCEAIYAHHIAHGVATFDENPPVSGSMGARHARLVKKGYPFFVGEGGGGKIVGYAYAGPFRDRSAYRFSAEDSIYLDPAHRGQGLAQPLLDGLIAHTRKQGLKSLIAVIGMDQQQDMAESPSVRAHLKAGFTPAGCLDFVGYKFDRWLKTVYMQFDLTAYTSGELK